MVAVTFPVMFIAKTTLLISFAADRSQPLPLIVFAIFELVPSFGAIPAPLAPLPRPPRVQSASTEVSIFMLNFNFINIEW